MSTPGSAPESTSPAPFMAKASSLLADTSRHRFVLHATLAPITGDRFQPAGFPEIGHVIFDAPRPEDTIEKVCILDSAASMANHLESVCRAGQFDSGLHPDLAGMPYLQCWTDDGAGAFNKLVVTSLSEGHRLASQYFLDSRAHQGQDRTFKTQLLQEFGLRDLANKTHPLVDEWWRIFRVLFQYDPNSLVHGILFPAWAIKIPRLLTAHADAYGAARVGSSGVKFDPIGKTNSGQPIFAVDEETAREIRATFVLDLALLRSFGREAVNGQDGSGLNLAQKTFLLDLALWKIQRLLSAPFRYRSNCDLELVRLQTASNGGLQAAILQPDVPASLLGAYESAQPPIPVFYPSNELFKPGPAPSPTAPDSKLADGDEPTDSADDDQAN